MSKKTELDFENLPPFVRVIFLATGQSAVIAKQHGLSKEAFIGFCSEIWETMEMNGVDNFSSILARKLSSDIDEAIGEELGEKLRRGKL